MSFLKNHKMKLIILVLLVFLAYSNVYQNEFLSDDIPTIVKNRNIGNLSYNLASGNIFDIIHSLNFAIAGPNPPVYHLTNVLFHTGNVILIYFISRFLLLSFFPLEEKNHQWTAMAAALLFAVHPVQTEGVTWISGGGYPLYSFFLLFSFLLFLYQESVPNKSTLPRIIFCAISLVSFILAFQTTEKAIIFPLILFSFSIIVKKTRKNLPVLLVFFAITAVLSFTKIEALTTRVEKTSASQFAESITFNLHEQIPLALASYLKLLFFPVNLTFYHETILTGTEYIKMLVITVVFIALVILFFKKSKFLFFSSLLFLIPLLPTITPLRIAWVVAERYLYLSTFGFTLAIAFLIQKLGQKLKYQEISTAILITILLFYLPLTLLRNQDWKNEDTLWPATAKASPRQPMARNNMGDYYTRRGEFDKAMIEFAKAIDLQQGKYPEAIHNLASVYLAKQQATAAASLYEKAIAQKPTLIESYVALSLIYLSWKDYPRAKITIEKALSINPNYSPAYNALGLVYHAAGDDLKAKEQFEKALSLDPNNPDPRRNLQLLNQKQP